MPNANEKSQELAQAQLDRFGPLPVVGRVYDVKTDEEIRKRKFNYNDLEMRKWWGKNVIWALSNGYAVELVKAENDQ